MTSYTIYRIAMTLSIMVFVVMAMLIWNLYPLTTIMIILLALLDDIPIMTIAWDNAELSRTPIRWQLDRLLVISGMFGALALAQSFGLYLIARDLLQETLASTQTMMFLRFSRRPPPAVLHPHAPRVLGQAASLLAAVFGDRRDSGRRRAGCGFRLVDDADRLVGDRAHLAL
jgi:hypothetical protein